MSATLSVLHCPATVGGHAATLARAERAVGLASWSVALEPSGPGYAVDEVLAPHSRLAREAARARLLARALRSFDVVHFNFGSPITPRAYPSSVAGRGVGRALYRLYARALELRDLPLLARAGKRVFVTYQGDDARHGDHVRRHFEPAHARELEGAYDVRLDERKRAWISAFDRYADRIYALNPDLLEILPARAEFLPYANVDLSGWQAVPAPSGRVPVVVHAPTDRRVKGTRFLLEAVERLRACGIEVELRLVEGVTQAEARHALEGADLVVDQLLAGWYGGVAVEAMALGKPVVAHIRESDLGAIPGGMRAELPVLHANPATIDGVLRDWIVERRRELGELGERSRAYVEHWHDPRQIAARLKEDYLAALASPRRRAAGARDDRS